MARTHLDAPERRRRDTGIDAAILKGDESGGEQLGDASALGVLVEPGAMAKAVPEHFGDGASSVASFQNLGGRLVDEKRSATRAARLRESNEETASRSGHFRQSIGGRHSEVDRHVHIERDQACLRIADGEEREEIVVVRRPPLRTQSEQRIEFGGRRGLRCRPRPWRWRFRPEPAPTRGGRAPRPERWRVRWRRGSFAPPTNRCVRPVSETDPRPRRDRHRRRARSTARTGKRKATAVGFLGTAVLRCWRSPRRNLARQPSGAQRRRRKSAPALAETRCPLQALRENAPARPDRGARTGIGRDRGKLSGEHRGVGHVFHGDATVAINQPAMARQLAQHLGRADETGPREQHLARDDRRVES